MLIPTPLQRRLPLLLGAISALMPLSVKAAAATGVPADCATPGSPALLLISSAMLLVTCLWQMGITVVIAELIHAPRLMVWCAKHITTRSLAMLIGAGLTALGLLGDILIWAALLRALNLFTNLGESFYYSAMTFTTVGYGDVVLPECWHLLSVGLAVNGLLMAGWSTALLVYVVQRIMEMRFNNHRPS
jgi:voltage-gated potassium channel Kch